MVKKMIDVKRERVEGFLKDNYSYITKKTIVDKLGLAKEGIRRHVKGGRRLPDIEVIKIDDAIMKVIDLYLEEKNKIE